MTSELAVALAEADEPPEFVNEGFPATLLRGAVRLFGRAAGEKVAEPAEKPQHTKPAKDNGKAKSPAGPSAPDS